RFARRFKRNHKLCWWHGRLGGWHLSSALERQDLRRIREADRRSSQSRRSQQTSTTVAICHERPILWATAGARHVQCLFGSISSANIIGELTGVESGWASIIYEWRRVNLGSRRQ